MVLVSVPGDGPCQPPRTQSFPSKANAAVSAPPEGQTWELSWIQLEPSTELQASFFQPLWYPPITQSLSWKTTVDGRQRLLHSEFSVIDQVTPLWELQMEFGLAPAPECPPNTQSLSWKTALEWFCRCPHISRDWVEVLNMLQSTPFSEVQTWFVTEPLFPPSSQSLFWKTSKRELLMATKSALSVALSQVAPNWLVVKVWV